MIIFDEADDIIKDSRLVAKPKDASHRGCRTATMKAHRQDDDLFVDPPGIQGWTWIARTNM